MRVHVVQVGTVPVDESFFTATRGTDALRGFLKRGASFPVFAFVVEHPDGHIVVDTGWSHELALLPAVKLLGRLTGHVLAITPDDEVGPRMRAHGLRPEDVRLVIPTHMDCDHAGGIGHFPNATIIVNRPEYEYVTTNRFGKVRGQPKRWPSWFQPSLYDLRPEPYGSFPISFPVTDRGDVRIVPTPGHSPAHVSPVVDSDGIKLFFAGDHMIRQDWITADGIRLSTALHAYKRQARETSERICAFVKEFDTIVVPSHDADAETNLEALKPLRI